MTESQHKTYGTWGPIIRTLTRWLADPEELIDDDFDQPSRRTLVRALRIARTLRETHLPVKWVSPTVDGGICFLFREGRHNAELQIEEDDTRLWTYYGTRGVEIKINYANKINRAKGGLWYTDCKPDPSSWAADRSRRR